MQRPGKIEKPLVVGRRIDKTADEAYKQSIIFHRTNIAALHEVRRWTNNEDQRFTRVGPRTLKVGRAIGDIDPDGRFVRRPQSYSSQPFGRARPAPSRIH